MVRPNQIRRLFLAVGWIFILMTAPGAGYGEDVNFSGTYSYVDLSAIWFFSVDETTGEITGFAWDVARQDIFEIVGTREGVYFDFEVETLYRFDGQRTSTNVLQPITGCWWDLATDSGCEPLNRRWEGSQLSGTGLLLNYIGEFAGSYTGDSSGTWEVVIDEDGACTGTLTPADADPADTLTIAGGINTSGEFAWEATRTVAGTLISRMVMRGHVLGNTGRLYGQSGPDTPGWRNTLSGDEGSFSGARDDALPVDYLDPNAESKTCFIDTLLD